MGSYEDLVRSTADALMKPGEPVSIHTLARLVAARYFAHSTDDRLRPLDMLLLEAVLRDDPRFVEVAPGMWVRRHDGPEAGVPSRPRRPPFAGSAAAAAAPPERHVDLDAVGGAGPPHEIRTPGYPQRSEEGGAPRFRGDPGGGRATTTATS